MIEPRRRIEWLTRMYGDCTFLGGTPEFDLWYFHDRGGGHSVRLVDNTDQWDEWLVEMLPPRGTGYFKDITLTVEQEESVETYLRCFAPWVLGTNLTEENNNE